MSDRTVRACPECDVTHVTNRTARHGGVRTGGTEEKYRCGTCGARFDEPVERPPKNQGGLIGNSGLAKTLAEMDPDDLGDDPSSPDP